MSGKRWINRGKGGDIVESKKAYVMTEFAQQLKEWRTANGVSQRALAKMLGTKKSTVYNFESRRNFPSMEIANKIAEITGLNVPTRLQTKINDYQGLGRQIAEWCVQNFISINKLASMLGISINTLTDYAKGRCRPSKDIAVKLAEITNISVPFASNSGLKCLNDPLSDEERIFAELHNNLIYGFLHKFKLPIDDWYGVAAVGYLKAVKKWFARSDLHVYSFSTIAFNNMRSEINAELRKCKSRVKCISLYDVIPGTKNLTYGDILCDPRDCVGI